MITNAIVDGVRLQATARDRLLDAAESLFFCDGIPNASVDAVLQRAAASPPTLYAHFGSKNGLLAAALERRLDNWSRIWTERVDAATTDQGRLLAIFDALDEFRSDGRRSRWCAFLSTSSTGPQLDETVAILLREETELLKRRLTELASPLADTPQRLADDIQLLYNGALASILRGSPDKPGEAARRLAAATIDQANNA